MALAVLIQPVFHKGNTANIPAMCLGADISSTIEYFNRQIIHPQVCKQTVS